MAFHPAVGAHHGEGCCLAQHQLAGVKTGMPAALEAAELCPARCPGAPCCVNKAKLMQLLISFSWASNPYQDQGKKASSQGGDSFLSS